jgi:hypothetical protein
MNIQQKLPELEVVYDTFYDKDTQELVTKLDVLFMYNTLARMFNGAIEEFNKNV